MMAVDAFLGRQIDDYLIEERIGRGGMATVYRATQQSVRRPVALKLIQLDPSEAEHAEFRQRFAREAELIAGLEHLHIMPVYGYGLINDDLAYLAMRWLRGGTLTQVMNGQPLPLKRALSIFRQVASALDYAHQRGIIHRDIKPSNILFDEQHNAYLGDFGLAKALESSQQLTQSGSVVGTPQYMSPEQLRGDAVDTRSDIYSSGILLYTMLSGGPPFSAAEGNVVSIIYQHLEKSARPLRETLPDLPDSVEAVVMTALAKSPDARYPTVAAMSNALQAAVEQSSTQSAAAIDVPTPSSPLIITPPSAADSDSYPLITPPSSTTTHPRALHLRGGRIVIALLVVLLAVAVGLLFTSRPANPAQAIVQAGASGHAEALRPTTDEIARADSVLGDGFIAYITCNTSSEYHATQTREMGDMAALYGLRYQAYDSDSNKARQIPLIERARVEGAVGLIVCPLDPELLTSALNAVDLANVPLVLMNGDMPSYGGVLIAGDEQQMGLAAGRAAGQIIAANSGEARAVILDYPDLPQIVERADGLEAGLLEFVPQAEIIGRYLGGTQENGRRSVEALLEQGIAFDTILSINDAGAFGAIEALAEAGVDPTSVLVSSIDAEALARQYIRDGYFIQASVEVGRARYSQAAVDSMVRLLAGSTLPERVLVAPGDVITAEAISD